MHNHLLSSFCFASWKLCSSSLKTSFYRKYGLPSLTSTSPEFKEEAYDRVDSTNLYVQRVQRMQIQVQSRASSSRRK
ncbi:unnamed protein product [Arabidopsis thaliana]|uniref:(thale cress) hypothetical protein n=1 Tax=Arabidopsis thaliana TaxID=3702 RepID=A0A7G2F216_ARATH|nr:unnamed protein product [Arabidopsis thaliana]